MSVTVDPARDEGPMDDQANLTRLRMAQIFITYSDENACHHCGGTQFEGFMDVSAWPAISVTGGCVACKQMRIIAGQFRRPDPSAPMIWWFVGDDVAPPKLTRAPGYIRDTCEMWGNEIPASQGSIIIPEPVRNYYQGIGRLDMLTFDFDWQHYPKARRFDNMVGMMFLPNDYNAMCRLPGVITDMNLFG